MHSMCGGCWINIQTCTVHGIFNAEYNILHVSFLQCKLPFSYLQIAVISLSSLVIENNTKHTLTY